MCVLIGIIASFLAMVLWHMGGAATWKCNGYGLEFSLAGHRQRQCALEEMAWYVNVLGSVY